MKKLFRFRSLAGPAAALGLLLAPAGAAQAQTPATFAVAATYTTGGTAVAGLAVADVNRDGKLDLFASNFDNGTVAVLLGAGIGTFGAATTFSSGGSHPVGVAAADVNGDSKLDMVVANQSSGTVAVLLGTGTGSFGAATTFSSGGSLPTDLVVADVNGDSKPDILTPNQSSGTVSVLLGTGTGSFGTAATFSTTTSGVLGLAVADLNNDTKPDLVVGTYTGSAVAVLLGTGTGSFGAATTFTVGSGLGPGRLALADVNADSRLDVLVSNYGSSTAGVLLGTGPGTFGPATLYNCGGNSPQDIAVADVNGDSRLDLLTANPGNNTAGVLLGTGPGTFGAAATFGAGGSYPYAVKAADVNGDSQPDLLIANYYGNTVGVLLNTTVPVPAPTLTSLNPTSGLVGTSVTLTGTNLTGTTGVRFNGTAATTFAVANATTVTATVPTGATTGNVTATTPSGTSNGVLFTVTYPDLVVSTTTPIAAGIYNSITVNSPGVGTLAGNVTVTTSTTVNSGGVLNDGCFVLSGPGSFTLAAGGTLGICHAQGISATPGQGALQNTGFRSLNTDASYVYNGTATQATGTLLPTQVRNLTTTNANDVILSNTVAVAQVVTVGAAGNLVSNTALTLLSSASGTALVVNSDTGAVTGTSFVQRYIDPTLNPGLGYRHYSIPVLSTSVQDMTTTGYSPVVNAAYNTSATPGLVSPFPTVFGYDETRLGTTTNNLAAFDKGFFSPASQGTTLLSGRGYVANVPASAVVDFQGVLTTGDRPPLALTRATGAALGTLAAETGWHLVGNPYPAPLDYSRVAATDRAGLDAGVYVVQSTGQYAGQYRSFVNNIGPGIGVPVIPVAQGFWVRVSAGNASGALTLRDIHRLRVPETASFQRSVTDTRPLIQLDLRTATGQADPYYLYAQAGATDGFDSQYDAWKLPNSTGLNLASQLLTTESLSIDGRGAFTATTTVALTVGVPAAGTYTLAPAMLANLPAGLDAYLTDASTGQTTKLAVGSPYSFGVTAAQSLALIVGRFSLSFRASTTLAATAGLSAASVAVFPNPAHGRFAVVVPAVAVAGAATVQAELLTPLGQVVRRQAAALPAGGTTLLVETTGLAPGVYTLRLQAGAATLARRVVVQ